MKTCVFPGSFDPVTIGHMDLIRRASSIFDNVTVTVMINPHKKSAISSENRVELLKKCCSGFQNVKVESWQGLLADYMRMKHETVIVRGIRDSIEYQNEKTACDINHMLYDSLETVFLPADQAFSAVSSSAVKEIFTFGGDISGFVPPEVTEEIYHFLSNIVK